MTEQDDDDAVRHHKVARVMKLEMLKVMPRQSRSVERIARVLGLLPSNAVP